MQFRTQRGNLLTLCERKTRFTLTAPLPVKFAGRDGGMVSGRTMGWSPEQIAGRLEQEGSGHSISHESIYRFICIGLDMIGQSSDLGVRLRASDRSAQQATATGWLC